MQFNVDTIFTHQDLKDKTSVFHFLAETAYRLGIASNISSVLQGLEAREAQGTTGMMDGFAIPHAQTATIQEPSVLIVQLEQGIDWESLDGEPIDFVFCLLIPDGEASRQHLALLAQIARLLMRQATREALKSATSSQAIYALLAHHLTL